MAQMPAGSCLPNRSPLPVRSCSSLRSFPPVEACSRPDRQPDRSRPHSTFQHLCPILNRSLGNSPRHQIGLGRMFDRDSQRRLRLGLPNSEDSCHPCYARYLTRDLNPQRNRPFPYAGLHWLRGFMPSVLCAVRVRTVGWPAVTPLLRQIDRPVTVLYVSICGRTVFR